MFSYKKIYLQFRATDTQQAVAEGKLCRDGDALQSRRYSHLYPSPHSDHVLRLHIQSIISKKARQQGSFMWLWAALPDFHITQQQQRNGWGTQCWSAGMEGQGSTRSLPSAKPEISPVVLKSAPLLFPFSSCTDVTEGCSCPLCEQKE